MVMAHMGAVPRGKESCDAKLRLRSVDCIRAAEILRKPDMEHFAPLSGNGARRARPVSARCEPSPVAAHADAVRMPARYRPARRWTMHSARDAEHHPDEYERTAGHVRIDQGFRPPRVKVPPVVTEGTMLGMKVAHRARRASRRVKVEARDGSGLRVSPATRAGDGGGQQTRGGDSLRGRRERKGRVLLQAMFRTSERSRRQLPRLGGEGRVRESGDK